jgi:hypothetical protein
MFQTKVVEKIRRQILCLTFFYENYAVYGIMWKKCCRAGQATDDNTTHAHCVLDKEACKYTLRMCNTYCFSIAIVVV